MAFHLVLLLLAAPIGAQPLTDADFPDDPPDLIALGKALFADPILSGNGDIACATCHDPDHGLSNAVSLGVGVGAGRQRQARNTPALWSLGARQMTVFFWDGRVQADPAAPKGIRTHAGRLLPDGLSGPLAAQTLFPMISPTEMAGRNNPVADASAPSEAWAAIARRAAWRYPVSDISEVANALAAYIAAAYRGTNTAYDRFAGGDATALTPQQRRGHDLFFGRAGCSECHRPPLFTDQVFHAIGMPQFGPGRTRRFDPVARDIGRMAVTDDPADAYRFRTPPLRGVALSAPYGHTGAWPTLAGVIAQHADPVAASDAWTPDLAVLPPAPDLVVPDFAARADRADRDRIARAVSIRPVSLHNDDIAALVAFLHALTPQ